MEQFGDMKVALVAALLSFVASLSAAQTAPTQPDRVAQAYEQFLLGRRFEASDKVEQAIAAYKRAMQLDPKSAEIPAELAALYLRQNRAQEALATAEEALKIDPANREAHRVAGFVYASMIESERGTSQRATANDAATDENLSKAIAQFEAAIDHPPGEPDPNVRATLARLYLRAGATAKAIPLLTDLIAQEPGWQDGPIMLAEAYAEAGRNADAIAWLERTVADQPQLYPTLADFYERNHQWKEAAGAYAHAIEVAPRNTQLKQRYASALLNAGSREDMTKARDLLSDMVAASPNDTRTLYLLAQAQRRLGDVSGSEATARRVIAQNPKSPWGYYALAESLEERHQYQAVIDALTPPVNEARASGSSDRFALGLLLPHLGFAYQELRQIDKALAAFEEAHKV
jgi:superkiller protein 3